MTRSASARRAARSAAVRAYWSSAGRSVTRPIQRSRHARSSTKSQRPVASDHRRRFGHARERDPAPRAEGRLVVGVQPVREAIRRHGAALREVLIDARPSPKLEALARFAADQSGAPARRLSRGELDALAHGVAHQGAAAYAPELELLPLEVAMAAADAVGLALDSLQDPQN